VPPRAAPLLAHLLPVAVIRSAGPASWLPPWTIELARGPAVAEAFDLLYSAWHQPRRGELVRSSLESIAAGELDPRHLMTARAETGELRGVALAVTRPGREAVLWIPVVAGLEEPVATDLIRELVQALARRLDHESISCQVCFLDHDRQRERDWLAAAGFPHVADLCRLGCHPDLLPPPPPAPEGTRHWQRHDYSDSTHRLFARGIDLVQVDSLDVPEIQGVRTANDVLTSHAASGGQLGDLWRVYTDPQSGDPQAILLLSDRTSHTLEILYIGVVPRARGQGVGTWLIHEARAAAVRLNRPSLEVAVESRNTPALRLYSRLGLVEYQRTGLHLRTAPHVGHVATR